MTAATSPTSTASPTAPALMLGEALIDVVDQNGTITEHPGGSPANVALTLGRLGRPVELATWVGPDRHGQLITDHLAASNVTLTPGSDGNSRTITASAKIDQAGNATYSFDMPWDIKLPPIGPGRPVVHTGSIALTVEPGKTTIKEAFIAAQAQATTSFDPNIRPSLHGDPVTALAFMEEMVTAADIVKVSHEDLQWLSPQPWEDVARAWLELGPALVIVTRAENGAVAFTKAGRTEIPGPTVKVVDTVGAGDSFMGGIIDYLWSIDLLGLEKRQALHAIALQQVEALLQHAQAISSITVSRAGANPPTRAELAAF